jgi:hypothetical protein
MHWPLHIGDLSRPDLLKVETRPQFFLSEQILEDVALLAQVDFVMFADVLGTIAEGAADIPAHVAAVELPGRTLFFLGAILLFPAGNNPIFFGLLVDDEKIQIFLNMFRNIAPPLFVAVNGANRNSKQFRQLLLGFAKLAAGKIKFVIGHDLSRFRWGLWVMAGNASTAGAYVSYEQSNCSTQL